MGCFGSAQKADVDEYKKGRERNKEIDKQINKDKQLYRATHRLLLLGNVFRFQNVNFNFVFSHFFDYVDIYGYLIAMPFLE